LGTDAQSWVNLQMHDNAEVAREDTAGVGVEESGLIPRALDRNRP
jgi:hypothetical protein